MSPPDIGAADASAAIAEDEEQDTTDIDAKGAPRSISDVADAPPKFRCVNVK
jgi:hypothetical protein